MAFYAFLDVLKVPKTMEQSIIGSIKPFDGNVTSQQVTLLDAQISIYMSHVSANMPDSIAALTQARANTDPSIKLALKVYTDSGKDFENTFIALLNNKARSYIISFKYEPEIRANALKAFNRSGATNNSSTQIIDKLTIKDEDTEADITAKKNALIVFIASENDNDITREALGKAISRPAARSVPPKKRQQVQAQSNGR